MKFFTPVGANRHLRLRALAGRERFETGVLTVSPVTVDFQLADLSTKPLNCSRMLQLLGSAIVRLNPSEIAKPVAERALRRLAWVQGSDLGLSPTTLLVLALLALPQHVKAQPVASEDLWKLFDLEVWSSVGLGFVTHVGDALDVGYSRVGKGVQGLSKSRLRFGKGQRGLG